MLKDFKTTVLCDDDLDAPDPARRDYRDTPHRAWDVGMFFRGEPESETTRSKPLHLAVSTPPWRGQVRLGAQKGDRLLLSAGSWAQ